MPATDFPFTETLAADTPEQVAEIVADANAQRTALYPIGGGTSLDYGLPAVREGMALQLRGLQQIIDYPARDMTITVGGGIRVQSLQQTLAAESQRLPIDAPRAAEATLAGLIATNHSGPLRFGLGTLRDYVIGISAIDGRGSKFSGGGRVVKNVAGYDFCKLLTGSLGTLGVITEVTLKLKPLPATRMLACTALQDLDQLEPLLATLISSSTNPVAIEYLCGPDWATLKPLDGDGSGHLLVGFEGSHAEVEWMATTIQREWQQVGVSATRMLQSAEAELVYARLVDFPADVEAGLVLQATGVPSGTVKFLKAMAALDAAVSLQAHAGNGVVIAKFAEHPPCGLATAVQRIRSVAASVHGHVTVLSNPSGDEMTHQCVWGAADVPYDLMSKVKRAFDPNNILNPGRFVYHDAF